jgi:hypothetical protein
MPPLRVITLRRHSCHYVLHATCHMLHATCLHNVTRYIQATCLHATCYIFAITPHVTHAAPDKPHATTVTCFSHAYYMRHMPHTSYYVTLLHVAIATCYIHATLHAAYATCHMPLTLHVMMPHVTCHMPHVTCLHASHVPLRADAT